MLSSRTCSSICSPPTTNLSYSNGFTVLNDHSLYSHVLPPVYKCKKTELLEVYCYLSLPLDILLPKRNLRMKSSTNSANPKNNTTIASPQIYLQRKHKAFVSLLNKSLKQIVKSFWQ